MPPDLPAWLRLLEQRHPRSIELGLGRCGQVRDRLGWHRLPFALMIVSGTNGKGSAVALLEACLRAAGYRTGAYTSPHLHRYNERVRVDGETVSDAALCAAFEQVEAARGDTPLTYFETGTLGAMAVFLEAAPDVVILEVGLGGRLDAVNMFDGDGALMTSVDLDHRDWLGDDVRIIGREKAGVFRAGRPAVCADPRAPDTVAATAATIGARFILADRDYRWESTGDTWWWAGDGLVLEGLPLPALPGAHQLRNAAGAIALLHALRGRVPLPARALHDGLSGVRIEGRLEFRSGPVSWLFDVAHNPEAARALAAFLAGHRGQGRTLAIFAMLRDKDIAATVAAVADFVDGWWLVQLDTPRAVPVAELAATVAEACPGVPAGAFETPQAALEDLGHQLQEGDTVVVFGSFITVAEVKRLESSPVRPETQGHG